MRRAKAAASVSLALIKAGTLDVRLEDGFYVSNNFIRKAREDLALLHKEEQWGLFVRDGITVKAGTRHKFILSRTKSANKYKFSGSGTDRWIVETPFNLPNYMNEGPKNKQNAEIVDLDGGAIAIEILCDLEAGTEVLGYYGDEFERDYEVAEEEEELERVAEELGRVLTDNSASFDFTEDELLKFSSDFTEDECKKEQTLLEKQRSKTEKQRRKVKRRKLRDKLKKEGKNYKQSDQKRELETPAEPQVRRKHRRTKDKLPKNALTWNLWLQALSRGVDGEGQLRSTWEAPTSAQYKHYLKDF